MLIDCDGCAVRDLACGDCVVTVLLGLPGTRQEVDEGEWRALDVLADSGLVPRLQLVPLGLPQDLSGDSSGAVGAVPGRPAGRASRTAS